MKKVYFGKRWAILAAFLLIFLLVNFVAAADTEIIVKTAPRNKVSIQVLDPSQVYALLNSYHIYVPETGKVHAIYSGNEAKVNLKVSISKDGTIIKFGDKDFQLFENYDTGKKIYILMMPGEEVKIGYDNFDALPVQAESNDTENSTTGVNGTLNATAGVSEPDVLGAPISGDVVAGDSEGNKKIYVYMVLGIILVSVIVMFLIFKLGGNVLNRPPSEIKVVKLSEMNPDRENSQESAAPSLPNVKMLKKIIQEKEEKLKQAEAEINRLRNQDKIREIERRMEEERKEIEKLKSGK